MEWIGQTIKAFFDILLWMIVKSKTLNEKWITRFIRFKSCKHFLLYLSSLSVKCNLRKDLTLESVRRVRQCDRCAPFIYSSKYNTDTLKHKNKSFRQFKSVRHGVAGWWCVVRNTRHCREESHTLPMKLEAMLTFQRTQNFMEMIKVSRSFCDTEKRLSWIRHWLQIFTRNPGTAQTLKMQPFPCLAQVRQKESNIHEGERDASNEKKTMAVMKSSKN